MIERLAVDYASGSLKIDLYNTIQHNIITITVYYHTEISLETQCGMEKQLILLIHPSLLGKRGISIANLVITIYFKKKSSISNKSDAPVTMDSEQPSQPKQIHSTEEGSIGQGTSTKKSKPKLSLQGTRKIGCNAGIHIREYILYPDYKVSSDMKYHTKR